MNVETKHHSTAIVDPGPSARAVVADDSSPPLVRGIDLVLFGLLTAIPWTALVASEAFYFPFVTPRAYVFRLMVQVLLLGCAVLVACDPRRLPLWSPVLLSWLVLAAIALAADLVSAQPLHSLVGDLRRMGGFATTAHLVALLLVAVTVLGTVDRWNPVLGSSLVASSVTATLAYLQAVHVLPLEHLSGRVDGGFGNPTYLAGFLLANVFIALYLLATNRPPRILTAMIVAIAVVDAGALVLTGTRSALLGLVVGAGVVAVARIPDRRRRRAVAGVILLTAVVAGIAITIIPVGTTTGFEPVDRVLATSPSDTTTHSRLVVWRIAIHGFAERPLVGWGEEGFLELFNRHYDPALWFHPDQFFDRPHNAPLKWLTSAGLPGLLAYLAVFVCAVVCLRSAQLGSTARAALGGLLAAHFVHTFFAFEDLTGAMIFVLSLGLIHTLERQSAEAADRGSRKITVVAAVVGMVAFAVAAFVLTVVQPVRAEHSLVAGVRALATQPERGLERLEAAAAASPVVEPFACERLLDAVATLFEHPEITIESRRRIAAAACEVVERYLERVPDDLRRRLLLARFLNRTGAPDAAAEHLQVARAQAPRRPDILLELATANLNLGRPEAGLKWAQAAHELAPKDPKMSDGLALAALYTGRRALAESLLRPKYGTVLVPDERFVAAHAAAGDFASVVATLARVSRDEATLRTKIANAGIREILNAAARRPEWRDEAAVAVAKIREFEP